MELKVTAIILFASLIILCSFSSIEVARQALQPEVEMMTNDTPFQEYLTRYGALRNKMFIWNFEMRQLIICENNTQILNFEFWLLYMCTVIDVFCDCDIFTCVSTYVSIPLYHAYRILIFKLGQFFNIKYIYYINILIRNLFNYFIYIIKLFLKCCLINV